MNPLKRIRIERDVSQKQLASAIGVRPNTIWRIEHNRANPSWEAAIKISEYLHCTLDELKQESTQELKEE